MFFNLQLEKKSLNFFPHFQETIFTERQPPMQHALIFIILSCVYFVTNTTAQKNHREPSSRFHSLRLEHPFPNHYSGFDSSNTKQNIIPSPLRTKPNRVHSSASPLYVVDTATIHTTSGTVRHYYSFNVQGLMTSDLIEDVTLNSYTYDDRGNLLSSLRQYWNGSWENDVRYTFTYDENNNKLSRLQEHWSGGVWNNSIRLTYSYDANSNLLSTLQEVWLNGAWENVVRTKFTYNGGGKILSESHERWENMAWLNVYRDEYEYDGIGNTLNVFREFWESGVWINGQHYMYTYDASSNMLSGLYEEWRNGEWVRLYQSTYTYDTTGNMITRLYEELRNGIRWQKIDSSTYTYDANGKRISEVFQSWENEQWMNNTRYTYIYDVSDNLLTELWEDWTNGLWVNGTRFTFTYNANGSRLSELREIWPNGAWVNSYRYSYTYTEAGYPETFLYEEWSGSIWQTVDTDWSVTDSAGNDYGYFGYAVTLEYQLISTDVINNENNFATTFTLQQNYPNPFNPQTAIGFSLLAVSNVTLKVYDVLGQEVVTLIHNRLMEEGKHEAQFDASNLSSGMYFYKLRTEKFSETKKMILLK